MVQKPEYFKNLINDSEVSHTKLFQIGLPGVFDDCTVLADLLGWDNVLKQSELTN